MATKAMSAMDVDSSIAGTERLLAQGADGSVILVSAISAYVIDGLQPQRLLPVLQVAIARFEQDRALRGQLESAQSQLSERKLVERAKGILMDHLGLPADRIVTVADEAAIHTDGAARVSHRPPGM